MSEESVATFRLLHASGCFVMPNPWDVGSAKVLEGLGFPALATTSAGLAWTLGRADTGVRLEEALAHFREISSAVGVPVNADFEGGYAVDPADVAANVTLAVSTGIAGLSIEDSSGDEADPLFSFDLAVERIAAARRAMFAFSSGVTRTVATVVRRRRSLPGRPGIRSWRGAGTAP